MLVNWSESFHRTVVAVSSNELKHVTLRPVGGRVEKDSHGLEREKELVVG